ncbi:hypothetical protein D9M71_284010 [compost metagenome]
MGYDFQVLIVAMLVTILAACSVPAWQSKKLFTPRERHVEVTTEQLSGYPNYGAVEFELRSANGEQLTANSASIGYGAAVIGNSQWGWLDTALTPRSDAISIPVPKLKGSLVESVQIFVNRGGNSLGAVRLNISEANNPHVGVVALENGQAIELDAKDGVSFRVTPHLPNAEQWRFSGVFLEGGGNYGRTY